MAKPSFVPPPTPAGAPFFDVPVDPPLDFAGPPENPGNGHGERPDDLPVDLSGLPPVEPPIDTPAEPPFFETPPVGIPDFDDLI